MVVRAVLQLLCKFVYIKGVYVDNRIEVKIR